MEEEKVEEVKEEQDQETEQAQPVNDYITRNELENIINQKLAEFKDSFLFVETENEKEEKEENEEEENLYDW